MNKSQIDSHIRATKKALSLNAVTEIVPSEIEKIQRNPLYEFRGTVRGLIMALYFYRTAKLMALYVIKGFMKLICLGRDIG